MYTIVIGCGKIGTIAVESLVAEGHDVTVIDQNQTAIDNITNIYDVMGVCGNGADCDVLREAGVEKARLIVATCGSDEMNMLSCYLARKMGAHHTVARIRNPEYNGRSLQFLRQHLHLSMALNPDALAAKRIFDILQLPAAAKIEYFSGNRFELIELKLRKDSPLNGISLSELPQRCKAKVLICTVQRAGEVFVPDGGFVLHSGDRISITSTPIEIQKFMQAMGILQNESRSVLLLGGSRVALYLAKMLTKIGTSVKIIEQNRNRCRDLCELLPKATIINGDGAKQELLLEEGLRAHDAFVALTGIDEENILLSIFAAKQGTGKVVAKISRPELEDMAVDMGIDSIVSPLECTSDALTRYARSLENTGGSAVEN